MDVLAASDSTAGADGPLTVVLGVAVLLLFVGILVRAVVLRRPGQARSAPRLVRKRRSRRVRPVGSAAARRGADSTGGEPVAGEDGRTRVPSRSETLSGSSGLRPCAAGGERAVSGHVDRPPPAPEPIAEVPEPELARLTSETLAPLGRTLERAKRLRVAEDRVAAELDTLPDGFWLVDRYVLVGVRRIPFLVAGATGVFVICATDGAWTLHDLHALSDLADDVRSQLPGYDGPVRAAVCLAFDDMEPRAWFGGQMQHGQGGWVMGLDWLNKWMFGFGPEHGLRNGDVRRLHEAAGPFWDRRSTARLPETRNLG